MYAVIYGSKYGYFAKNIYKWSKIVEYLISRDPTLVDMKDNKGKKASDYSNKQRLTKLLEKHEL